MFRKIFDDIQCVYENKIYICVKTLKKKVL